MEERHYFWSDSCLKPVERTSLHYHIKISSFFEYMFWILSIVVIISVKLAKMKYPAFLYLEKWPFYIILFFKIGFVLTLILGYYIGNSHHAYYTHGLLHNYYQMRFLVGYIRNAIELCEKTKYTNKTYSAEYQKEIKQILLCGIRQHRKLKM